MAKAKKDEESKEEGQSSNDALGSLLNDNKGDHYNDVIAKNLPISTGSLLLDSLITVRSGSIIRLCGAGAELGKTSEAFVLADNFHKVFPKGKTIYIKAESRLSVEMQKRSGHTFVTTPTEWAYGTIFVWSVNYFETIASTLESLLKTMHELGEQLCIIWDSLDGTILKSDAQKDVWGNESVKVAGVPLLSKLLFKRFALPLTHYDALMIITSQYSANIKIDPYAKDVPRQVEGSGGSAIGHQSDYVLYYCPRYQGDYILEDQDAKPDPVKNKTLGVFATIDIRKSGTDVTGTKVKIPIARKRIGSAIWVEKEVVDMAMQLGQLTRKGAWYSFSELLVGEAAKDGVEIKVQHQGLGGVYQYIETNKSVFKWLYNKFR